MTQVSKHLRVAVPTVSVAVQKGGAIIEEKGWALATLLEKLQIGLGDALYISIFESYQCCSKDRSCQDKPE
jgi:hypothetical protein